jgi:hypothetical protein
MASKIVERDAVDTKALDKGLKKRMEMGVAGETGQRGASAAFY